jgi:cell division septal protein FtsQ
MWSTRRVLRRDKKDLNKKRILLISLLLGGVGIFCVVIGIVMISHEPVFISPLPFLRSLGLASSNDTGKKQIETFMKAQNISYKDISLSGKTTYIVKISDNGNAYITTNKDVSEQLSSLQRIHSRLTMEGKKFSRLDLRYDKPVIVLQ